MEFDRPAQTPRDVELGRLAAEVRDYGWIYEKSPKRGKFIVKILDLEPDYKDDGLWHEFEDDDGKRFWIFGEL